MRVSQGSLECLSTSSFSVCWEIRLDILDVFSIAPPNKNGSMVACGAVQNLNTRNTPKITFWNVAKRDEPYFSQEIEKAHEISFLWAPNGEKCLIWCQTLHDETGKSYYGEHQLYYFHVEQQKFCKVPKGDGPVHDVAWNPNSSEFVLLSGFMPATCTLYNADCSPVFDYGKLYANTIRWSPLSRFILLGGFGNLSGNIQVWDTTTRTKIGECKVSPSAFRD